MRDDVDVQPRVAVVAPDGLDQPIEPARRFDVVLAPVIGMDVVAALAWLGRNADRAAHVASEVAQRFDELAVEIVAQRRVGDVERFQVVGQHREGLRIEIESEMTVVVEHDHPRRAGPRLDAGRAVA